MIEILVTNKDIDFAKNQISEFEKIKEGQWRYADVEAWRGIVCEMLASEWLSKRFNVNLKAKGLDTSGVYDEYDLMINNKKIEIKSATKNYFRYIMPKTYDVNNKPKDIYIGAKYNETIQPNKVYIIGFIKRDEILCFPIKQNKGAPYYEIPFTALKEINELTF